MKILSLMKRYVEKDGVAFWHVNVVLKAENDLDTSMLDSQSEEYSRVHAIKDLDAYIQESDPKEMAKYYTSVHITSNGFLERAKVPGVYYMHEYYVGTKSVKAILEELDSIKNGETFPLLRHTEESHILSLLAALNELWD